MLEQPHRPSQESLNFRENLSRLISPLRRVRPRVPFFQLAAHRIPTLWSLYRGLLRGAPTETIRQSVQYEFRKNRHLTGTGATKRHLEKGYEYLDAFKKANAGDKEQQKRMKEWTRKLVARNKKAYWNSLADEEVAWQKKLSNRPIMTGGYLRPSYWNPPLPRLKPQPVHITGMIRNRRIARERRMLTIIDIQETIQALKIEATLEEEAAKFHRNAHGANVEAVYAGHLDEWNVGTVEPLLQQQAKIHESFDRDQKRRSTPYSKEMLDAIKAARREKIANKTRELERERRGEVLRRTVLRSRQGPPAHILSRMTPKQRRMDKIARSVSEVGYVAMVKKKLGFKLRNPDAWKVELGSPENKKKVDRMVKEIYKESERRGLKAREEQNNE
ncbi:hypothetical protein H0H93_000166 [Arthromyces matolae]|nr:hypothetical protein H0H93_000166 [Arthromyces matolae]